MRLATNLPVLALLLATAAHAQTETLSPASNHPRNKQKFFGSFFQKRTASFLGASFPKDYMYRAELPGASGNSSPGPISTPRELALS
jgi:hypothetical protein